jgi:hypothetical protein
MKASKGQTFKIFCECGVDVRKYNLTADEAEQIIFVLMQGGQFTLSDGVILQGKVKVDYKAIYEQAIQAGNEAGNAVNPTPMVVQQHRDMLDDNSPVVKSYHVSEGVCGFAWVNVKANTGFGKWLKKRGICKETAYHGGYNLWCSGFGQSYDRKCAWASAVSQVLNDNGIKAYYQSRLD